MLYWRLESAPGFTQLAPAVIRGVIKEYLGRSARRRVEYFGLLTVVFLGSFLLLLMATNLLIKAWIAGPDPWWLTIAGASMAAVVCVGPFVITKIVRATLLRRALAEWIVVNWIGGRASRCYHCMYDLTESDGHLCPECGAGVPTVNTEWFGKR